MEKVINDEEMESGYGILKHEEGIDLMPVRAAETSAEGVSIYQHDPKGRVWRAYQSLTEEVLGNGQ